MFFNKYLFSPVINFFKTGEDKPLSSDQEHIKKVYGRTRLSVFLSIIFGYSFFYVCRLSFSVAKKPILDAGVLNTSEMGKIGFALFLTYAFGKLINGFLADRSNIRRFMATGLLVSAVMNVLFGMTDLFVVFLLLWMISGWFQSMGSAPSVVTMSHWFSNKERGTRYGIWSTAHSIGEGVTFLGTAAIISYLGWRWGFWVSGIMGIIVAQIMYRTMADRPQTYGLPSVADYRNDHAPEPDKASNVSLAQFEVIKNPAVWVLGISSACMYVARYGVNSWGPLFFQEEKGYTMIAAGTLLFWAKLFEVAGALTSGMFSDFFFKSKRNLPAFIYGAVMLVGLLTLFYSKTNFLGKIDSAYMPLLKKGIFNTELKYAFSKKDISLPDDVKIKTKKIDILNLSQSFDQYKKLKKMLNSGQVPSILTTLLENKRMIVSSNAIIKRINESEWQIKDKTQNLSIFIKNEGNNFKFYQHQFEIIYPQVYKKYKGYRIEESLYQLTIFSKFNYWHFLGLALFGFGLGGSLVFLGGLMAVDICSKKATGAAMGLVGVFSYLGAAIQDWTSGNLIDASKTIIDGQVVYNFENAIFFWVIAVIIAVLLPVSIWKVKAKD